MFCKYCGTQVPDGYVCNCPDAQKERAAAANVATAPAAAPAAGSDIGKKIGDAFKGIPAASKKLMQDTSGNGIDLGSAIIFAGVCLIGYVLGFWLMFSAILGDLMKYLGDFVGTLLWAGCVTAVVSMAVSFLIGIVMQAIRKEKVDAITAFVKTACLSVTPALLFLLASVLMFVSAELGLFVILVAIMAGTLAYANRFAGDKKKTAGVLGTVLTSIVLALAIVVIGWLIINVFTGYLEGKMGGSVDITDLMGMLR